MPFYVRFAANHLRSAGPIDDWDNREFYNVIASGRRLEGLTLSALSSPLVIAGPDKGEMLKIFCASPGAPWFVSSSVRDVIERLEPNVHNFIPVNTVNLQGETFDEKYYMLHLTQAIDAVVIEETDFASGMGRKAFERSDTISTGGICTLLADKINGHHLWRGSIAPAGKRTPFANHHFCSDELAREFEERLKISNLQFMPCKTK